MRGAASESAAAGTAGPTGPTSRLAAAAAALGLHNTRRASTTGGGGAGREAMRLLGPASVTAITAAGAADGMGPAAAGQEARYGGGGGGGAAAAASAAAVISAAPGGASGANREGDSSCRAKSSINIALATTTPAAVQDTTAATAPPGDSRHRRRTLRVGSTGRLAQPQSGGDSGSISSQCGPLRTAHHQHQHHQLQQRMQDALVTSAWGTLIHSPRSGVQSNSGTHSRPKRSATLSAMALGSPAPPLHGPAGPGNTSHSYQRGSFAGTGGGGGLSGSLPSGSGGMYAVAQMLQSMDLTAAEAAAAISGNASSNAPHAVFTGRTAMVEGSTASRAGSGGSGQGGSAHQQALLPAGMGGGAVAAATTWAVPAAALPRRRAGSTASGVSAGMLHDPNAGAIGGAQLSTVPEGGPNSGRGLYGSGAAHSLPQLRMLDELPYECDGSSGTARSDQQASNSRQGQCRVLALTPPTALPLSRAAAAAAAAALAAASDIRAADALSTASARAQTTRPGSNSSSADVAEAAATALRATGPLQSRVPGGAPADTSRWTDAAGTGKAAAAAGTASAAALPGLLPIRELHISSPQTAQQAMLPAAAIAAAAAAAGASSAGWTGGAAGTSSAAGEGSFYRMSTQDSRGFPVSSSSGRYQGGRLLSSPAGMLLIGLQGGGGDDGGAAVGGGGTPPAHTDFGGHSSPLSSSPPPPLVCGSQPSAYNLMVMASGSHHSHHHNPGSPLHSRQQSQQVPHGRTLSSLASGTQPSVGASGGCGIAGIAGASSRAGPTGVLPRILNLASKVSAVASGGAVPNTRSSPLTATDSAAPAGSCKSISSGRRHPYLSQGAELMTAGSAPCAPAGDIAARALHAAAGSGSGSGLAPPPGAHSGVLNGGGCSTDSSPQHSASGGISAAARASGAARDPNSYQQPTPRDVHNTSRARLHLRSTLGALGTLRRSCSTFIDRGNHAAATAEEEDTAEEGAEPDAFSKMLQHRSRSELSCCPAPVVPVSVPRTMREPSVSSLAQRSPLSRLGASIGGVGATAGALALLAAPAANSCCAAAAQPAPAHAASAGGSAPLLAPSPAAAAASGGFRGWRGGGTQSASTTAASDAGGNANNRIASAAADAAAAAALSAAAAAGGVSGSGARAAAAVAADATAATTTSGSQHVNAAPLASHTETTYLGTLSFDGGYPASLGLPLPPMPPSAAAGVSAHSRQQPPAAAPAAASPAANGRPQQVLTSPLTSPRGYGMARNFAADVAAAQAMSSFCGTSDHGGPEVTAAAGLPRQAFNNSSHGSSAAAASSATAAAARAAAAVETSLGGEQQRSSPTASQHQAPLAMERWHEVVMNCMAHPGTGEQLFVVTQTDVSARVWAERQLAVIVEAEHALLEAIYPAHVIEHIALTAAAAAAKHTRAVAETGSESSSRQPTTTGTAAAPGSASAPSRKRRHQQQYSPLPHLAAAASGGGGGGGIAGGYGGGAVGGGGGGGAVPITGETFLHLATSHSALTVLFCDIEGFTNMCGLVRPGVVMAFLNDLFTRLDALLDVFGVYKVETIGDCYMVAGGLMKVDEETGAVTVRSDDVDPLHAHRTVQFAKALLAAASEVLLPTSGEPVRLRVGIHSGSASVVGTRMPRFCLFGDTVNTASRMESTGEAGTIHVSGATRDLVPGEAWQPTGGIAVKGKGVMETFKLRPEMQYAPDYVI